jgi:hypothetical protein
MLQSGGTEAVVYSGILGTVGALVPFTTRDEVDFFTHLEMCVDGRITSSHNFSRAHHASSACLCQIDVAVGTCGRKLTALLDVTISCTAPTTCLLRTLLMATCTPPSLALLLFCPLKLSS